MTHSIADAGKRVIVTVVAVITAGILVMGCATPAYAKSDNGWGEEGYVKENLVTPRLKTGRIIQDPLLLDPYIFFTW